MEDVLYNMGTEMGGWGLGLGGGLWMLLLARVLILAVFALIKYLAK